MLACYLFSIKDNPALTFLTHGPKVWLEELLPKYALFYPVQTACIQGAIKFLPKLDRATAAAAAAAAPAPDFETPVRAHNAKKPVEAPPPDFE